MAEPNDVPSPGQILWGMFQGTSLYKKHPVATIRSAIAVVALWAVISALVMFKEIWELFSDEPPAGAIGRELDPYISGVGEGMAYAALMLVLWFVLWLMILNLKRVPTWVSPGDVEDHRDAGDSVAQKTSQDAALDRKEWKPRIKKLLRERRDLALEMNKFQGKDDWLAVTEDQWLRETGDLIQDAFGATQRDRTLPSSDGLLMDEIVKYNPQRLGMPAPGSGGLQPPRKTNLERYAENLDTLIRVVDTMDKLTDHFLFSQYEK